MLTAAIVFALTYLVLGIQQIPRVHLGRPSGALLGTAAAGKTLKATAAVSGTYELRVAAAFGEAGYGGYEIRWKAKPPRDRTSIRESE